MNAEDFTNVPTSMLVEQTVALARSEPVLQSDVYWEHVRLLHFRSGRDVFERALGLFSSVEAISRAVGADILAQLGVQSLRRSTHSGTSVEGNQRSSHDCQRTLRKTFVTRLHTHLAAAQTAFLPPHWSLFPATSTPVRAIGRR